MLKKMSMLIAILVLGISTVAFAGSLNGTKNSTVTETSSVQEVEKSSLEEQLEMLEMGIVPTHPDETVEIWAKAVKQRNGALQYALMTKEAKASVKNAFEKFHWVTGVSSPWVESFKVINKKEQKDKTFIYEVEFRLATSTGYAGKDYATLMVGKNGDQWFIEKIKATSDNAVGIWKTPEEVNGVNIDNNLNNIKDFESKLGYKIQLPQDQTGNLVMKDSTCENEEGNPACTHFYYKDNKENKDILLMTVLLLTEKQSQSSYYQEHPFIKHVAENQKGIYYYLIPSEFPYAKSPDSKEAKEAAALLELLKEHVPFIILTN